MNDIEQLFHHDSDLIAPPSAAAEEMAIENEAPQIIPNADYFEKYLAECYNTILTSGEFDINQTSESVGSEEFRKAIDLVAETAPETLFIIQPVTPYGGCKAASPEKILICQNYALTKLKDVRVIPQTHKMIGQI